MARRLFHYQRYVEAHFVSLLSDRKVKLSRPDSFNDPWDCRLRFRDPSTAEERDRILSWLADMHRKHQAAVSEAKRAELVYDLRSSPAKLIAALRKMESGMYAEICRMYRVYCLTEKPELALMWGHYAGGHTGLCLEFDANSLPFGAATRVEYQKLYPAYDLVDVGYEPLVAKSIDWSYEAEWRLIAEERGVARSADTVKTDSDFLTLPPGVLKSVTVGCLADAALRQSIRELVAGRAPYVVVRQAAIASDTYEIRITPPFSP